MSRQTLIQKIGHWLVEFVGSIVVITVGGCCWCSSQKGSKGRFRRQFIPAHPAGQWSSSVRLES